VLQNYKEQLYPALYPEAAARREAKAAAKKLKEEKERTKGNAKGNLKGNNGNSGNTDKDEEDNKDKDEVWQRMDPGFTGGFKSAQIISVPRVSKGTSGGDRAANGISATKMREYAVSDTKEAELAFHAGVGEHLSKSEALELMTEVENGLQCHEDCPKKQCKPYKNAQARKRNAENKRKKEAAEKAAAKEEMKKKEMQKTNEKNNGGGDKNGEGEKNGEGDKNGSESSEVRFVSTQSQAGNGQIDGRVGVSTEAAAFIVNLGKDEYKIEYLGEKKTMTS
jgi:hypothetical protein